MFLSRKTFGVGSSVSLLASLLCASPLVLAEERLCTGSIGAVTLDNIFVPDGASCVLTGTRAKGNIVVGTAASLRATRVSVNGNIQAEGANLVSVGGNSSIGGSIQIVQGGSATIDRVRINGDLFFDENWGAIRATNNNVGANLQAFQNTGGVFLSRNFIKGNLQCKANRPAPTGGGNQAGSKEDQCARL